MNALAEHNNDNHIRTQEILEDYDLQTQVIYRNSKGAEFSNSVRDIFFHVLNHSNNHRAQVAKDMKDNGVKPLSTDYIFYKRR